MNKHNRKMQCIFNTRFSASILLNSSYTAVTRRPDPDLLAILRRRYSIATLNSQVIFAYGNICYSCGVVAVYAGIWEDKHVSATIRWFTPTDPIPLLMTADHIIPLSANGSRCKTNLQPLCYDCNQAKSNRKPMQFETQLVTQRKKILELILECGSWAIGKGQKAKGSTRINPASYDKLCLAFPGIEDELLNLCKKMV